MIGVAVNSISSSAQIGLLSTLISTPEFDAGSKTLTIVSQDTLLPEVSVTVKVTVLAPRSSQSKLRVSKAIRAGITFVNTYRLISPSAPFGGMKDSGYGKEAGIDSIKDYTRVKTTWFYTSDEPSLDPFSIR